MHCLSSSTLIVNRIIKNTIIRSQQRGQSLGKIGKRNWDRCINLWPNGEVVTTWMNNSSIVVGDDSTINREWMRKSQLQGSRMRFHFNSLVALLQVKGSISGHVSPYLGRWIEVEGMIVVRDIWTSVSFIKKRTIDGRQKSFLQKHTESHLAQVREHAPEKTISRQMVIWTTQRLAAVFLLRDIPHRCPSISSIYLMG